jgi:hypothetical protein
MGNWINFHQDPTTRDIVQDSITKGRRTPFLIQSDFNFTHEIKVSKNHEGMRLGFNANVTNLFNQRTPLVLNPAPLATGYTTPTATSGPIGWDYKALETNFNYLALMNDKTYAIVDANAGCSDPTLPCPDMVPVYNGPNTNGKPNTLASRYGKPVIFQSSRAMRLQLRFTF